MIRQFGEANMNLQKQKSMWSGVLLFVVSGVAFAHPGVHVTRFVDGMSHPLSGFDHMFAMFAVGVWAAQLGGRAIWTVPTSFVAMMALAGWIGTTETPLPMVESGIATSVLVLGLLIAFSIRTSPVLGAGLVALFAVFHGYAHGVEMPGNALWSYGFGFVLATALLHGVGILAGLSLRNRAAWLQAAGALVAISGLWIATFA
jgi:urease accessory protein